MTLRIYDFLTPNKPKFNQNLRGIISEVISLSYTRRAYDIGSFELSVPKNAEDADTLKPDRMVLFGDDIRPSNIVGTTTYSLTSDALYITDVETTETEVRAAGYDLKYFFAQRITLFPTEEQEKGTYGYFVAKGTTLNVLAALIDHNIVNSPDPERNLFGLNRIVMPVPQLEKNLTGIQDDRVMTRLEPLSTVIFGLLKNCKTHYIEMRVSMDRENNPDGYVPRLVDGEYTSDAEPMPNVVITEECYNIQHYNRKSSTSAYKNAIYAVAGQTLTNDTIVQCVTRPDTDASSVARKETVVNIDIDNVSETDKYALKAAEEYVAGDSFEITPIFGEDETALQLAQNITVKINGETWTTRITEITDEYTPEGHTITYVTGDKQLKILNLLNNNIEKNTSQIINNKFLAANAGGSGVGKFVNDEKNSEIFNDYTGNTSGDQYNHVEGRQNSCSGFCSHVEGYLNAAGNGSHTHVEGCNNTSKGSYSHIEGTNNTAESNNCHVEGEHNTATAGGVHHVEGSSNHAGGDKCHIEGTSNTVTLGARNHLEGWKNTVNTGSDNHLENEGNTVTGSDNHASGYDNVINGDWCAVFGRGNKISNDYNTVFGKFNEDKDLAFCVGIGTAWTPPAKRKNGLELDWNGNLRVEGDVIARNISPISISDTIDENSTNDRAAGGKAVYDFVTAYAAPISNVQLQAIIDQAVGK